MTTKRREPVWTLWLERGRMPRQYDAVCLARGERVRIDGSQTSPVTAGEVARLAVRALNAAEKKRTK